MIRIRYAQILVPFLFLLSILPAAAQPVPGTGETSTGSFKFGPPLRTNYVFAYVYTERVHKVLRDASGAVRDSSERILSYYITQRQLPEAHGSWTIEANIDSMKVEYRNTMGSLKFNTQDTSVPQNVLRHEEVFVPATLVNRMTSFYLSPYGELVRAASPSLESVREQAKDPAVRSYYREQIEAMTRNGYLQWVMLPWHGLLPVDQEVAFYDTLTMDLTSGLGLLPMQGKAAVTLLPPVEEDGQPHLRYLAELERPLHDSLLVSEIGVPTPLRSARINITGDLTLDDDGVVRSGWSTATGQAVTEHKGETFTVDYRHDTTVEFLDLMYFPIN